MKKENKKKLEQELVTALENVLAKHDIRAVEKTKKVIRQSGKAVVKRFSKTLKSLAGKKDTKAKKKSSGNASIKRAIPGRQPLTKYDHQENNTVHVTGHPEVSKPAGNPEGTSQQQP
jgi:hypothetical protein